MKTMMAPWIEYPELLFGSLGWRMGGGEGYMDMFLDWFYQQNERSLNNFFAQYPPPDEWQGFIDLHLIKMKTGKKSWEL